jgi:hypothetical protein
MVDTDFRNDVARIAFPNDSVFNLYFTHYDLPPLHIPFSGTELNQAPLTQARSGLLYADLLFASEASLFPHRTYSSSIYSSWHDH